MKTVAIRISILISVALVAAPATAQQESQVGSRLTPRNTVAVAQSPEAAALAGQRLAGCIYVKQRSQVLAALDAIDPADASRKIRSLQSKGTCINLLIVNEFADSQRMQIPNDIYRGLLAEAVIRNGYANHKLAPRTPGTPESDYTRPWFSVTDRAVQSDEMSVCVADTDPAGIAALLTTDPGSGAEKAAIRALSPSLGPCLSTGTKLSSNRQSVRAGLAEALYHRLVEETSATPPAPRPSPAGKN